MKKYSLTAQESSIVLVGDFNPAIYHPEWLARHNLISPDDLLAAKVDVVHNDLAKFSLEWLAVDVFRNKFVVRSNDPSKSNPLRDLVAEMFSILEHTPITHIGINYNIEYSINEEDDWHKIGDTLAPKTIWEKTLQPRIGLTKLSLTSPRKDDLNGSLNVSLQPSTTEFQVLKIGINNHITIKDEDGNIIYNPSELLINRWDEIIGLSKEIIETTIQEILGE